VQEDCGEKVKGYRTEYALSEEKSLFWHYSHKSPIDNAKILKMLF
jgi:hypothetical protein